MNTVRIGSACSKAGGHISFDFEGGGCGFGEYAEIVLALRGVEWRDAEGNQRDIARYGDQALKDAAHEINTALQFWINAGRPEAK